MKNKKNKKKILYTLLLLVLLVGGIVGVYAAVKYYEYKWTNEIKDVNYNDSFITNDMIELDDGTFVAIGFDNTKYNGIPSVRHLSADGFLMKEMTLDDIAMGQMKYIVKIDDGFLVFGADGVNIVVLKITDNYKLDDIYELYSGYSYDRVAEIYLVEDDKNYYLFASEYAYSNIYPFSGDGNEDNGDKGEVIRISKSIESEDDMELITEDDYTDTIKKLIKPYVNIWNYYYFDNLAEYYWPSFITEYNGGYVYGLEYETEDYSWNNTLLVYVKDDKEVWAKKYEGIFYKDAIELNGNLLLAAVDYVDEKSYLLLTDENLKELCKDDMASYISKDAVIFLHEHLISVGTSGFSLTGSESYASAPDPVFDAGSSLSDILNNSKVPDKPSENKGTGDGGNGEVPPKKPDEDKEPNDVRNPNNEISDVGENPNNYSYTNTAKVLYFNASYSVYVNTTGKGTVTPSKTKAGWGEEITFTIKPEEGYVLKAVKVTDASGNVVTFTDYQFTMPNADVTIDVMFVVENPETYAFISVVVFAALGGSLYWFIANKKKKNYIEE